MNLSNKIIFLFNIISLMLFPSTISVSQNTIVFTDFTEYDLDSGYKTANFTLLSPLTINLNLDQNEKWELFIQATDYFLNNYNIIPSDIEWKESNKSIAEYKPLTIDKHLIINSENSINDHIQLNFRMKVTWQTIPGTYNIPFQIRLEKSRKFSNKKKKIRTWPNQ